jgi:hypothetical protein
MVVAIDDCTSMFIRLYTVGILSNFGKSRPVYLVGMAVTRPLLEQDV